MEKIAITVLIFILMIFSASIIKAETNNNATSLNQQLVALLQQTIILLSKQVEILTKQLADQQQLINKINDAISQSTSTIITPTSTAKQAEITPKFFAEISANKKCVQNSDSVTIIIKTIPNKKFKLSIERLNQYEKITNYINSYVVSNNEGEFIYEIYAGGAYPRIDIKVSENENSQPYFKTINTEPMCPPLSPPSLYGGTQA